MTALQPPLPLGRALPRPQRVVVGEAVKHVPEIGVGTRPDEAGAQVTRLPAGQVGTGLGPDRRLGDARRVDVAFDGDGDRLAHLRSVPRIRFAVVTPARRSSSWAPLTLPGACYS